MGNVSGASGEIRPTASGETGHGDADASESSIPGQPLATTLGSSAPSATGSTSSVSAPAAVSSDSSSTLVAVVNVEPIAIPQSLDDLFEEGNQAVGKREEASKEIARAQDAIKAAAKAGDLFKTLNLTKYTTTDGSKRQNEKVVIPSLTNSTMHVPTTCDFLKELFNDIGEILHFEAGSDPANVTPLLEVVKSVTNLVAPCASVANIVEEQMVVEAVEGAVEKQDEIKKEAMEMFGTATKELDSVNLQISAQGGKVFDIEAVL